MVADSEWSVASLFPLPLLRLWFAAPNSQLRGLDVLERMICGCWGSVVSDGISSYVCLQWCDFCFQDGHCWQRGKVIQIRHSSCISNTSILPCKINTEEPLDFSINYLGLHRLDQSRSCQIAAEHYRTMSSLPLGPVKQAKKSSHKSKHYVAPGSQIYSDTDIGNISTVARIMKSALPDNAKIAREAKECMQECVSEFISFITSEGKFSSSESLQCLLCLD